MDINSLPDDPAALKALIVDMAAEHQALEQRLRLLNLIIYGPKSEKKPRTGQEQQLSLFVEKYPNHSQISYGRNLLGRAYLDDGKAKEAAPWFLKNYQSDKQGARAPDSLLYLASAMIAMNDTKRACIALAEFSETYPAVASGRLKSQYDADRAKVKCN